VNNRDWWDHPVQDSRSAHDYGRNNAPFVNDNDSKRDWTRRLEVALLMFIVVAVTMFIACHLPK
jgi:hypothetical protein